MPVLVRNLQRRLHIDIPLLRLQTRVLRNALDDGAFKDHDVAITLISSERMRAVNSFYRNSPRATDVLSFRNADLSVARAHQGTASAPLPLYSAAAYIPSTECESGAAPAIPPRDMGDILMCVDVCAAYAREEGWKVERYLPVVATHGLAHLAGYTHEEEECYAEMKAVEREALRELRAGEALADGIPESYLP